MRGLLKLFLVLPFLSFAALAQDVTPDATVAQTSSVNQDMAAADPQDPFVRGLKRLDEKLRLQREAEELARRALELQREAERRAEQEAMGD